MALTPSDASLHEARAQVRAFKEAILFFVCLYCLHASVKGGWPSVPQQSSIGACRVIAYSTSSYETL